jgi:hypothetical protein
MAGILPKHGEKPGGNAEYAAQMRYYDDTHLTPYQTDKLILELRQRGLSYRAIGRQVHMSANGVMYRLRCIQAGRSGTARCG